MKDLESVIEEKGSNANQTEFDLDSSDLGLQIAISRYERYKGDTKDRRWLAKWSVFVVLVWLLFVMIVLCFNNNYIGMSDTVLVTLLGTTTLNILGLSFIVLRGHFVVHE